MANVFHFTIAAIHNKMLRTESRGIRPFKRALVKPAFRNRIDNSEHRNKASRNKQRFKRHTGLANVFIQDLRLKLNLRTLYESLSLFPVGFIKFLQHRFKLVEIQLCGMHTEFCRSTRCNRIKSTS